MKNSLQRSSKTFLSAKAGWGGLLCLAVLSLFSMDVKAAVTTLTTSSNSPWLAPGSGTYSVTVEWWGSGGAGGGAQKLAGTTAVNGGGGGGGTYARSVISVMGGNPYTFTVGAGGLGVTNATGNAGGDTSFNAGAVLAKGGTGGVGCAAGVTGQTLNTNCPGGAGGLASASVGTTAYSGGAGAVGTGNTSSGGGGGGGGSGGSAASGNSGSTTNGAAAVTGGGPGGNGAIQVGAQGSGRPPASGPGGGGGGAATHGTANLGAGGNGYDGQIVLTYTVPTCTTPDTETVSGTTAICAGGSAIITMSPSQSGATYQLYAGASPVGNTTNGTGSPITWNVSPVSTTTYTVITTTNNGYCAVAMSGSAVVTLNAGPTAVNANTTATQNQRRLIDIAWLLGQCTAPDGDAFYLTSVNPSSTNGAPVTITATNTISYLPTPGFTGADHFNYTITDMLGCSATAEVDITVNP